MIFRHPLILRYPFLRFLLGFAILLGLLALDQWFFATFLKLNLLSWYLAKGSIISLGTSFAALAWGDINKHTALISSSPLDYLAVILKMLGLPLASMGSQMDSHNHKRPTRSLVAVLPDLFDVLLSIPIVVLLIGGALAWLIIIAPLQYFVNLVCGAPVRALLGSSRLTIARMNDNYLVTRDIQVSEPIPEGWWNASLTQKPVTMTNLIAVLVFFALQSVVH